MLNKMFTVQANLVIPIFQVIYSRYKEQKRDLWINCFVGGKQFWDEMNCSGDAEMQTSFEKVALAMTNDC